MKKEQIIQELIDFVEGRMSIEEFKHNYETNKDYVKLFDDTKPFEINYASLKGRTVNFGLQAYFRPGGEAPACLTKNAIWHIIKTYLQYYNVSVNPTTKYTDAVKLRQAIQPSYVEIEDDEYFDSIISSAPNDLNEAQKKKWLKDKIKDLFRYDKSYPRWIQSPEWPIIDGKPLVFKSQTKRVLDDERVWYTFYDPDTGKETVIVQFS